MISQFLVGIVATGVAVGGIAIAFHEIKSSAQKARPTRVEMQLDDEPANAKKKARVNACVA